MLENLWHVPELMTTLGFIENTPIDFHSNRWSNLSPGAQAKRLSLLERQYEILQGYSRSELQGQKQLTFDFLDWTMSTNLMVGRFPYHLSNLFYEGPYPANQLDGLQVLPLDILSQMQQVDDQGSAERYLERIAALPAYIDSLLEAIGYRADMGVVPPRIIVQQLIDQVEKLLQQPAQEWSIYQTLVERLSSLDLEPSVKEALLDESSSLISSSVIPAYREYRAFLDTLAPRAPDNVGMWTLPDGGAYYRALRQQAINYMHEYTGMSEADVTTEIDRYIVSPGQACAYMVGMLEILSMREDARNRQQERFRLVDFHQAILENGALPLALLRRQVTTKLQ